MKKRIGNDITFVWTVQRKNGEQLTPEDFTGKECVVKLYDKNNRECTLSDITFATGMVTFTFKGKDQETIGNYIAVLYENQGEDEMVTVDKVKAVTLVAHSYMEDDEECPCGTVEVESVELESEISTGGSSTPIDAYTKAQTDALLADKVDVLQIQGGYTASRYMSGTSFFDNSDQQGRVRSAAYEVGGIMLVDLNGNIAHLQVNGVLQLNGKALATEDDTALLVDGGDYNSQSKEIELKHGNTVLTRIDARAFVKDGMVDSVVVENGYIVITFNTDAGKEAISLALTDIFNPANYYDKTAVDNLLANKVDKVSGKGLSTEDYTTAEKTKLGDLPTNSELTTALAGKQATLTAGDNIAISSNVISANNEGWEHAADQFIEIGIEDHESEARIGVNSWTFEAAHTGVLRVQGFLDGRGLSVKLIINVTNHNDRDFNVVIAEVTPSNTYVTIDAAIDVMAGDDVYLGGEGGIGYYCKTYPCYIEYPIYKTLATVGTTGSYNDLSDKPTIPDVTGKADKVSNATNGNFAALDSNGNLIDSGHKHSDYLTQHQDLSNYVQKSQTAGLLKNDGTVDTTQYLSQHQDISGKEDITPIEAVASGTTAITAQANKYYEVAGTVSSLTVTLPTPTANTEVTMVVVHLTVGASPTILVTSSATVAYSAAYAVVANKEYELSCLYNGSKWIVSSMEVAA